MVVRLRLLCVFALGGCCSIPVGNEVFTVNGTVPPDAQTCDVYLRNSAGEEVPSTRRRVSGNFQTDYPVTHCTAAYQVIVACDGAERRLAVSKPRGFCAG